MRFRRLVAGLVARLLAGLLLAFVAAAGMPARTAGTFAWGVQGDRFTVDGEVRFLTLVSYFDALDASDRVWQEDFAYFRAHGVDGIRVFPNWWDCADLNACKTPSPRTLMDIHGALRPPQLERLRQLLDAAAAQRLIVDLSFAREPVRADERTLNGADYETGLLAVTRTLKGQAPHAIVDLQNEIEIHGLDRSQDIAADAARLRDAIRTVDPSRLVIASTGSRDLLRQLEPHVDAVAYHDPRVRDWWSRTSAEVTSLKALSRRPIYFQEPIAYQLAGARPGRDDVVATHFIQARESARVAGAAAWLFHTRKGFRLDDRSFVSQQEPGDREFFAALAASRKAR
jgi:hypothetical protein